MGHKSPSRQSSPDAAPITLRRYTHVLDGELERARDQLDKFLAEREQQERGPGGSEVGQIPVPWTVPSLFSLASLAC